MYLNFKNSVNLVIAYGDVDIDVNPALIIFKVFWKKKYIKILNYDFAFFSGKLEIKDCTSESQRIANICLDLNIPYDHGPSAHGLQF